MVDMHSHLTIVNFNYIYIQSTPGWVSARAEISARVAQTGLKFLSYNRVLCFIRILQQDRAETQPGLKSLHVISPLSEHTVPRVCT